MKAPRQAPDMKSAWNIMSHFSSYKEWVLLTKNCTKSPSRSMLSGKLSRKLSRKLKKMMFDGPFLIRIAVRPLKSTDKQKNIKIITCSILENPRRNRLSGRRAGCFETVRNISAENLSLTKQDRFEIHISTKNISSKSPQVPGPASRSECAQKASKALRCTRPGKPPLPRRCWSWFPVTQKLGACQITQIFVKQKITSHNLVINA